LFFRTLFDGRRARDPGAPRSGQRGGRLRPLLAAASLLTAAAGEPASAMPVGGYFGNPDGDDPNAESAFESQFDSFAALMGSPPQVMNGFVDFTQSPNAWPSNAAWTAWSWTQSPVVGTSITPVIGIPMSDSAHWEGNSPGSTNDDFFQSIVAGTYDADYQGVVDAWVNAGFKTLYLRLGYEMDGSFMPWFMGSTASEQSDWVAAFQHLSTLMRGEAQRLGATAYAVWNPADINWTALNVMDAYPGDGFVDVISCDSYSPVYPLDLYNWQANDGSSTKTLKRWWKIADDRRHFWSYPNATQWNPQGTGYGWSMASTIALALAHQKPLAISESGAGGDGSRTGPIDDPAFPDWLAGQMKAAASQGITIAYVSIWDVALADGDWDFSSATAQKPHEAASWAAHWGVNAAIRRR
jgi:type II secretory pathway pseudopilin PulG